MSDSFLILIYQVGYYLNVLDNYFSSFAKISYFQRLFTKFIKCWWIHLYVIKYILFSIIFTFSIIFKGKVPLIVCIMKYLKWLRYTVFLTCLGQSFWYTMANMHNNSLSGTYRRYMYVYVRVYSTTQASFKTCPWTLHRIFSCYLNCIEMHTGRMHSNSCLDYMQMRTMISHLR